MLKIIDQFFFSLRWPVPLVFILSGMGLFAAVALKKKHLTYSGALAAFITGVIILFAVHFQGFFLLLYFYGSSYIIEKYRLKRTGENICGKKASMRNHMQVIANGLMAVLASLQFMTTYSIPALVMFGAAIAEATSDTWAGEIGRMSAKPPISIRTLKIVPKGISGGVTALGFAGAFAGSFSVGILWFVLFPVKVSFVAVAIITFTGFSGCVFDSLLGATCQALYLNDKTDSLTEEEMDEDGKERKLVRGLSWFDNDMVNLLSNVFSSVFALALSKVL